MVETDYDRRGIVCIAPSHTVAYHMRTIGRSRYHVVNEVVVAPRGEEPVASNKKSFVRLREPPA